MVLGSTSFFFVRGLDGDYYIKNIYTSRSVGCDTYGRFERGLHFFLGAIKTRKLLVFARNKEVGNASVVTTPEVITL